MYIAHAMSGFYLENCPRGGGGGGGNWRNLDFKGGGMMFKDVIKFHKRHLGGRGMLVCVCRVSYMILSFRRRGNSKVRC